MLVTSREALRIGGEHVYPVGSAMSGTDSEPAAAVALFWERAEAANPRFDRGRDQDSVAEICRRLDGLPLAIELAAARTNLLQPAMMVERLGSVLTLLTSGTRDAPARQRSLRACLSWSVDLLNEDERRVFTAMAVFAGGSTLTSFEAVCVGALPDVDPLAMIESLVAKSLVRSVDGSAGPDRGCWRPSGSTPLSCSPGPTPRMRFRLAHARHFHNILAGKATLLPWPPRNAERPACNRLSCPTHALHCEH